jgi:integrase
MKLDSRTIATLKLGDKADAIFWDDSMPRFGYRLRRGAGGKLLRSWVVQYRRGGGHRRITLGSAEVLGVEAARKAAKETLAKVELGHDPAGDRHERRDKDRLRLRTIIDDYLAVQASKLRPASLREITRYLTAAPYFDPLHNMPIDTVSRRDVAARVLAVTREHSSVVAARARTTLSTFFAWAMGEGLAESNPVVGTNPPEDSTPRERVLTDQELATIWRACRDDDFGRIVKLCILLGARRSEVGGMAWNELDLDRGLWSIPAARTKNKRAHKLPLMSLALGIIRSVPQLVGRDLLFGAHAADGFTAWGKAKRALDARLGAKVKPWTLHDLRRSAATRLADLGVQPHVIEQVLNHQSGHKAGPAGIYNRSSYERDVRAALALWEDHLRSLVEGGERKVVAFSPGAQ